MKLVRALMKHFSGEDLSSQDIFFKFGGTMYKIHEVGDGFLKYSTSSDRRDRRDLGTMRITAPYELSSVKVSRGLRHRQQVVFTIL